MTRHCHVTMCWQTASHRTAPPQDVVWCRKGLGLHMVSQLAAKFGLIASSRCRPFIPLPARQRKADFLMGFSGSVVEPAGITHKCRGQAARGPCVHSESALRAPLLGNWNVQAACRAPVVCLSAHQVQYRHMANGHQKRIPFSKLRH